MRAVLLAGLGAVIAAALTASLSGCAAETAGQAVSPTQPAASAAETAEVKVVWAMHRGQGACRDDEREFVLRWEDSPSYDPLVVFVRQPDPKAYCIRLTPDELAVLAGTPGKPYQLLLEHVNHRGYRLRKTPQTRASALIAP